MTDRDKLQRIEEATEEARAFMATSYDHRTITAAAMERIASALLDLVASTPPASVRAHHGDIVGRLRIAAGTVNFAQSDTLRSALNDAADEIAALRAALGKALDGWGVWAYGTDHPERPDSITDAEIYDQAKIEQLRKRHL